MGAAGTNRTLIRANEFHLRSYGSTYMRYFALLILFLTTLASVAGEVDYAKMSSSDLIDALSRLEKSTVGLDGLAGLDGFLPVEEPKNTGGVWGSPRPATMPEMLELIRRGAAVLPLLVQHIQDRRVTNYKVGGNSIYSAQAFLDEYDPKNEESRLTLRKPTHTLDRNHFGSEYTVKIGDVCFVIIGQIVNRNLRAVRYQPTGILIVNSPVATNTLAEWVREDWGSANELDLQQSLIEDVQNSGTYLTNNSALIRLRFYYPIEYQKLKSGPLRQPIEKFEEAQLSKSKN
jgi:hypothetical protein